MYKIIGADGKEYGPVSAEQMRQWLNEGRVNKQTRVLREGAADWQTLGEVPELAAVLPPMQAAAPNFVPQGNIPNYLTQAILVTLCCCLPVGIPAIIYASQVKTKLAHGDIAGAHESSSKAKLWCWIGFGLGLVGTVVYVIIQLLLVSAGVASQ